MNKPKFNLLSDAELAQEMEKFENLATQELQMPPVMNPRSECTRVLSEDPDIAAGLESKMAFVDISLNIADRVRYTALQVRGVFLFLTQNASLCCGYSKELTQWDDSFQQPLRAPPLDMTYKQTFKLIDIYLDLCAKSLRVYASYSYGKTQNVRKLNVWQVKIFLAKNWEYVLYHDYIHVFWVL